MVLSLSPGAAPLEKAEEMAKYAQMWRISDDEWDVWQSSEDFPQGVNNQFERAAQWAVHSRPGNWPDADMLAIGRVGTGPGMGQSARDASDQGRATDAVDVLVDFPFAADHGREPVVVR